MDPAVAANADPTRRWYEPEGDPFSGSARSVWSATTDGTISAPPAVTDTTVYTGSYDGAIHAFDRADGSRAWKTTLAGEVVTTVPVATDTAVYAASFDDLGRSSRHVYALDPADGAVRWSEQLRRGTKYAPTHAGNSVFVAETGGTPLQTVDPGDVSSLGELVCLDAEDGERRWTTTVGPGRTAVAGATAYHQSGTDLFALDVADGSRRWMRALADPVRSGPLVLPGTVVVGTSSNDVRAFDRETGDERWSTDVFVERLHSSVRNARSQTPPRRFAGVSSLAADDRHVFAGTYNAVFALDPGGGDRMWVADFDCRGVYAQSVVGDRLHFGSGNGGVYATDLRDGTGSRALSLGSTSYPRPFDGSLYVTTADGTVCAYQ